MTIPLAIKLNKELERLKIAGEDFSPADLAKKFNTGSRTITQNIRYRPDVYRKIRCNVTRASVWGFREESS
jgi:hypothetical protein